MSSIDKKRQSEPLVEQIAKKECKEISPGLTRELTDDLQKRLRDQILYYMSDKNLCRDRFFHTALSKDPEGWFDASLLMKCNKVAQMTDDIQHVISVMDKLPEFEIRRDPQDKYSIRRLKPLPALEATRKHEVSNLPKSLPKHVSLIHQFGVLMKATGIPSGITWQEVKQALAKKLASLEGGGLEAKIRNVKEINDQQIAFIYMRSFPNDEKILQNITTLEIGDITIQLQLIDNLEDATKALSGLPAFILKERDRLFSKWKTQLQKKPLMIGGTKFDSIQHLRQCFQDILTSTPINSEVEESASKIIMEILKYHPRADEKTKSAVSVKVSTRDDLVLNSSSDKLIKCFFVQRSDGTMEDFSIRKCLNTMMENPPVVQI